MKLGNGVFVGLGVAVAVAMGRGVLVKTRVGAWVDVATGVTAIVSSCAPVSGEEPLIVPK